MGIEINKISEWKQVSKDKQNVVWLEKWISTQKIIGQ